MWCRVNCDHGFAHGLVEGVVSRWAQIIRKGEGVEGSFEDGVSMEAGRGEGGVLAVGVGVVEGTEGVGCGLPLGAQGADVVAIVL